MTYEQYFAHYGIDGQKWGVQNGPPYPLGAGQHSAAEAKDKSGWTEEAKRAYRAKESEKVVKRHKKAVTKNTKKLQRKGASEEQIRNSNKYHDIKRDYELRKIQKMDVGQDKKQKTKHIAKDVAFSGAMTAASLSLASFASTPAFVIGIHTPYNRLNKTDMQNIHHQYTQYLKKYGNTSMRTITDYEKKLSGKDFG